MPVIQVYTGYTARAALDPFHERTQREAILITHRQFGKTVGICNDAIERGLMNTRDFPAPAYAWFYPTRVRAKDIAWKYVKHYAKTIPGVNFSETELRLTLPNHATLTLYGADKSRGVGLTLDGVYYDEADEIPQKVVSEVEPTLAAFKGFTVFAGMLRGRYNLFRRYEDAAGNANIFRLMIRASQSGIFDPEELAKMRRIMGEAAYEMQMECNANASIANAIYGAQMDALRKAGRITKVTVDPTVPLDIFFDIGHSMTGDDWSMWAIQLVGRDVLVLEYYARTGEIPAHYAAKVIEIESRLGARVRHVYLPHDGSRKDQLGKSSKDHLEDAGLHGRIKIVTRTPNVWDGINNVRALMARMYIDQEGCGQPWMMGEIEMPSGIDCLDFYTKKIETTTGLIKDVPVHNQYSHGADAMRTFAESYANNLLEGTSDLAQSGRRHDITVTRKPMEETRRMGRAWVTR